MSYDRRLSGYFFVKVVHSVVLSAAHDIGWFVFCFVLALKAAPARCGPNKLGEVFDGKCLYLQHQLLTVGQAQRVCARLGGNLVAIGSQQKQVC